MDFFDTLHNRHSYRGVYKPTPVPRADLWKIIEAGCAAPSGCNAQTPRFVIIDDIDLIRKIGALIPGKSTLDTAPALIAVISQELPVFAGMTFGKEDYSAAVQNMLLAITALNYASVWLDGVLRIDDCAKKVGALLNVPSDRTVSVLLPIGVPEGAQAPPDKLPITDRAWYNKFGG